MATDYYVVRGESGHKRRGDRTIDGPFSETDAALDAADRFREIEGAGGAVIYVTDREGREITRPSVPMLQDVIGTWEIVPTIRDPNGGACTVLRGETLSAALFVAAGKAYRTGIAFDVEDSDGGPTFTVGKKG